MLGEEGRVKIYREIAYGKTKNKTMVGRIMLQLMDR